MFHHHILSRKTNHEFSRIINQLHEEWVAFDELIIQFHELRNYESKNFFVKLKCFIHFYVGTMNCECKEKHQLKFVSLPKILFNIAVQKQEQTTALQCEHLYFYYSGHNTMTMSTSIVSSLCHKMYTIVEEVHLSIVSAPIFRENDVAHKVV